MLYALARTCEGPILEIGPWCGLSTLCIIYGIVDSQQEKEFITVEFNQSLDDYVMMEDGSVGGCIGDGQPVGFGSLADFERNIKPILEREGRAIGMLKENLERYGFLNKVSIFEGDFRQVAPKKKYGFIFADCCHTELEIVMNLMSIRSLLGQGAWLALHDINDVTHPFIDGFFRPIESFRVPESLYVAKMK